MDIHPSLRAKTCISRHAIAPFLSVIYVIRGKLLLLSHSSAKQSLTSPSFPITQGTQSHLLPTYGSRQSSPRQARLLNHPRSPNSTVIITAGWLPSYWEYTCAKHVNPINAFWAAEVDRFLDPMPYELHMERIRQRHFGAL